MNRQDKRESIDNMCRRRKGETVGKNSIGRRRKTNRKNRNKLKKGKNRSKT